MDCKKLLREAALADNIVLFSQIQHDNNVSEEEAMQIMFEAHSSRRGATPEHLLYTVEEGFKKLEEEGYIDGDTSWFPDTCE